MQNIRYEIKTYDINNPSILKKRVEDNILISDIDYGANLNGGQGSIDISIATIDSSEYKINDILEVQLFRTEYSDVHEIVTGSDFITTELGEVIETELGDGIVVDGGVQGINKFTGFKIYKGVIKKINKQYKVNECTTTLTCYGVFTLLNNVLLQTTLPSGTGPYKFTREAVAGDIVKEIVDRFQTKYDPSIIYYNESFVDDLGSDISVEFDYDNCFSALNKVQEVSGKFFYFDSYGSLKFGEDSFYDHVLTYGKDVIEVDIDLDGLQLINWARAEDGFSFYEAQDNDSILDYGVSESFERIPAGNLGVSQSLSRITDITNNKILDFKEPLRITKVKVVNTYPIETIRPGHTITIRNFTESIEKAQIKSINYTTDFVELTLERLNVAGFSLLSI